ncbi:MAG: HPr family phosphocarrier protein [Caulobacteraceae bacterium]|nr:HPr family phosphocarrier protein [Caulobacteraceae bacterium]
MTDEYVSSSATLVNRLGLHARPAVKLTKLAKTFASEIELTLEGGGRWIDAKSIVKVMAVKAAKGATLRLRAKGPDAEEALAALRVLVAEGFAEDEGHGKRAEPLNG